MQKFTVFILATRLYMKADGNSRDTNRLIISTRRDFALVVKKLLNIANDQITSKGAKKFIYIHMIYHPRQV